MNVDWAYDETTWGSGLDPLLIQIDMPTREYIPTIHSAHVTIQMLLELHSKINIFTQKKKKGINNLWKKNHFKFKALNILLSSCHFIAHHCPWVSSPGHTQHVFLMKAPRTACLTLKATRCPLHGGGTPQSALRLGRADRPRLTVFPAGTSLWEHLMVLFFLNLATRFPGLPQKTENIERLWQGCPELTSTCLMLGCFFCLFVLIFKTSLTNTRVRDHVWATLRRAYLNCCPTYGICLNTRFANPTKVQLF